MAAQNVEILQDEFNRGDNMIKKMLLLVKF